MTVILEAEKLREAASYFKARGGFSYDVETVGEHRGVPHLNTITWLSMATDGATIAVPMGHPVGTKQIGEYREPRVGKDGKTRRYRMPIYEEPPVQLERDQVFEILRPLFFDEGITKNAHGASFDVASTAKYWGEVMAPRYECTIVLDWLLNENRHAYNLKQRTKEDYGLDYDDEHVGRCVEKYPFGKVARYAQLDARYTWLRYCRLRPQIETEGLQRVWELEMQILTVMVGMRLTGAPVDTERLRSLRVELSDELEEITARMYVAAGTRFNINSTPQKQKLLFGPRSEGGQGLKPWKLTQTGKNVKQFGGKLTVSHYSTDDEVLESFPNNSLASTLREYQDTSKLLGTYVDSWLGVEEDAARDIKAKPCLIYDGRIHADFVQYGTVTGRFSCRAPNLQNIPRSSTERGKIIRNVFRAPPGYKLIVADYGQIELVVLAHYIGKGKLYQGFLDGIDPHTMTAAGALRKDPSAVTPDERQKYGKSVNFAVVFGATYKKVASMIGCADSRAKEVLGAHEDEFPEIYAFKDAVIRKALSRRPPYITTLIGRKRRLPGLFSRDDATRMYAERQAVNSLIQGSAADLIKMAMVRVDTGLGAIENSALILTVHDELGLLAPDDRAEEVAAILKEGMTGEGIQKLIRVPLKADVSIAEQWGEAK